MRLLGVLCTFALFLFLIASAPGYAQDRDNGKPQAQEQAKPKDNDKINNNEKPQVQEDKKAEKQEEKNAKHDEKRSNENINARQDDRQNHPEDRHNANRPEDRQQHEQRPADNRPDMARHDNHGGGRGRHIPDDQFRSHFGREHTFRVQRTQIVNVSQPVIVYGGYSFELIDAWPAEWSYDDDCYIDYVDDEYYLFDVMHPGIRIAVFVVG